MMAILIKLLVLMALIVNLTTFQGHSKIRLSQKIKVVHITKFVSDPVQTWCDVLNTKTSTFHEFGVP